MTPQEYRQASELFSKFREMPERDLPAALDHACNGNLVLRSQVLRLLEADRNAVSGSFLERPALEDAALLLGSDSRRLPAQGVVIGRCRLGARIGAGGMGVVYEADDLGLQRRVAVKVLSLASASESEESIQRFQREAHAASGLNHPNIVSIFGAGFDDGCYYIAMEFIAGKTLRELIGAGPGFMDGTTVLDVIGQAASALSAAHDAGIVHRDIKPENIMVRPDGIVKVLDFGLAKLRDAPAKQADPTSELQTRPGHVPGTTQYLSPEQVLGKPAGPRSDLFSLGVVAYELATGVRPFDGPTDWAIFDAILNRTPAPPSSVRPSLGDELDGMILEALEKDPELRVQTAGDFRSSCRRIARDHILRARETDQRGHAPEAALTEPARPAVSSRKIAVLQLSSRARSRFLKLALAAPIVALGALLLWMMWPLPPPLVTGIVQVTHDGLPKEYFVTEGKRLYYAAGNQDRNIRMFQVSNRGEDSIPMPQLTGMVPLDVSRDGSEMLLGQILKLSDTELPLWVANTLGSSPRRLGDLIAQSACWSARGDEILYARGNELWVARSDGSESRRLVTVRGLLQDIASSPDGHSIRFTLEAENSAALWEVAADGTHLHEVFPEWAHRSNDGGVWTPDGKYFLFSVKQVTRDLWAVRASGLHWRASRPVRLTTGPLIADLPKTNSHDPRIFFRGRLDRGELVRYDRKSDQWLPYLDGLAAMELDYSRDGKWITWASYPDESVWRSAIDGSKRLQLTVPPLVARNPRWSPNGSQITFYGGPPGKPDRVYSVVASGGAIRRLTHGEAGPSGDEDGSWSPDGASMVFGPQLSDDVAGQTQSLPLEILDLNTQGISKLNGSEGLWSPRWSPDGRYIAALGTPKSVLWLYDMASHTRTQLTATDAGWPSWSLDSQYVYFKNTAIYRVRIKDKAVERLTSLNGLAGVSLGWVGLTPEGSLISTRNAGSVEIYALDWEAR